MLFEVSPKKLRFSLICAASIVTCVIILQYLSYTNDYDETMADLPHDDHLIDYNNHAIMAQELSRVGAG
jgi:hypothetical protein